MSIGLDLCVALLQCGDLEAVKLAGVTPARFTDDEKVVFEAIVNHHLAYGAIPARETLAVVLGEVVVQGLPEEVPEPLQFYIDKVNRRALGVMVAEHAKRSVGLLTAGSPEKALEAMQEAVTIARRGGALGRAPVDIATTADRRFESYWNRHQYGVDASGVRTPWPIMNRATMGLELGTFTALAGRIWAGKTWIILKMVEDVWVRQKKSPLLISMEMPPDMLGRRLDAIRAGIPYTELLTGTLDFQDEETYRRVIAETKDLPPLFCAYPPLVRSVEDVRAMIQEYRPDGGVWIDGLNRLRSGGDADRYRRVAEAADEVKFLAEDCAVPLIGTTHLNKAGGKSSRRSTQADLEDFGYAYAIPEQMNNGFIILSSEDMDANKTRLIKTLKVREEAEHIPGFFIHFDHTTMDFSEIGVWDGEDLDEDGGFDQDPVPF